MARPRSDAGIAPARERLIAAFWDELAADGYDAMTVRSIAQRAGVNKNSFYYHFEHIEGLATCAVTELPAPMLLARLLNALIRNENMRQVMEDVAADPVARDVLSKLHVIAGEPGNLRLLHTLIPCVLAMWRQTARRAHVKLAPEAEHALVFMLNGIISVVGCIPRDADIDKMLSEIVPFLKTPLMCKLPSLLLETMFAFGGTEGDVTPNPSAASEKEAALNITALVASIEGGVQQIF